MLKPEQQRLKDLLTDTITLLCKNGLQFSKQFSVDALIGITLDNNEVFLVKIDESVKSGNAGDGDNANAENYADPETDTPSNRSRKRKNRDRGGGGSDAKMSRSIDDDDDEFDNGYGDSDIPIKQEDDGMFKQESGLDTTYGQSADASSWNDDSQFGTPGGDASQQVSNYKFCLYAHVASNLYAMETSSQFSHNQTSASAIQCNFIPIFCQQKLFFIAS